MRHAVEKREELMYEGGVEAFVKFLDRNKTPLIPKPVMIKAERDGIVVECALWWNDSYHESVLCFTNNIPQRDGRHASRRLPRRADAPDHAICRHHRHDPRKKRSR